MFHQTQLHGACAIKQSHYILHGNTSSWKHLGGLRWLEIRVGLGPGRCSLAGVLSPLVFSWSTYRESFYVRKYPRWSWQWSTKKERRRTAEVKRVLMHLQSDSFCCTEKVWQTDEYSIVKFLRLTLLWRFLSPGLSQRAVSESYKRNGNSIFNLLAS
jgi:hypothetical protein